MNLRNTGIALLLVALLLLATQAQPQIPAAVAAVGRYQLVSGEYESNRMGKITTIKSLYRIDTATGQVREYIAGTDDKGQELRLWQDITSKEIVPAGYRQPK